MISDKNRQKLEEFTYRPDDYQTTRRNLNERILEEVKNSFPLEWGGVRLEAENIHITGPKNFTKKQQKDALLKDEFLGNSLIATLILKDSKTGEVIDTLKSKTLLKIPFYTERGTIIHNGNEYSTLNQIRLRPGVYNRIRSNGELESQFNVERGTGSGFRISMNPETGIYKLEIGQSSTNLYSILHDLGVSDDDLKSQWGSDIFEVNKAHYDPRALNKVHSKFVGNKSQASTQEEKAQELKLVFDNQLIDKDIKEYNLS